MKTKLHYVLLTAIFLSSFSMIAQNSSWKTIEGVSNTKIISKLNLEKDKTSFFELDLSKFKTTTASANLRSQSFKKENTIVSVPAIGGKLTSFKIYEAPVLSAELAAKYPNIKSYVGYSTNNTGATLYMSMSPLGVQTMISYPDENPTVFMQPISKGSSKYVLYNKDSHNTLDSKFECKTIDALNEKFNKNNLTSKPNEGGANNQTLQVFQIAISTTAEYTAYHDDGNAANGDAVADALAGINTTLTRVNAIFETDMAIRFELVDATQVIYTDPSTDPYSSANVGANGNNFSNTNGWNLQLQNTLTNEIGNAAYDIGHLFAGSGGGGNAGCIGCVCENPTTGSPHGKGSAYTASNIPEGDTFDIDLVAHEIGHQMGANHTWAFSIEGAGVNSEPGSGTTIMAYAGIQGADNVELNSDDYFHYHSIKQILDNINTKSCQTTQVITNNSPSADAGSNYSIPKGTAYVLKGAATDADGTDNLTYTWEQIDSGQTNYINFGPTLATGSMNRSLPPSSSPDRYIPKLSSVLAGNTTQTNPTLGSDWETASTVARTLNWALVVRDRSPVSALGGQSSYDTMQITVEDVTPFTISNPISWAQGSNQTIEWVVGETNNATINCQNVNIKLSTDGGLTFPITIASNTPNDGAFDYTVPAMADTANARILIEAADNIFYDVSNFDFSISTNPDFFIVEINLNDINCGDTTASYSFQYEAVNGFSETVTFSASGNPGSSLVTFSPASLNNSGTVTMTISNLNGVSNGNYPLVITGTPTAANVKNETINFPFFNGSCSSIGNTVFKTSTTLVQFNTINNTSAKPSGYSDYTTLITDVEVDASYDLTVNANTDGNYTTATRVWIDWNQNCSFDDAGETYDLGDATNVANGSTTNSPFSITVPSNAIAGHTIMRVSTKFKDDGLPTPCESGFDGEVEDYTLNILESLDHNTEINLVQFNTINQISDKPSDYSDYTSVITEVNRDSSYDLTVNVSTERNFTTTTKAWIDWDQNNVFTDPGEVYDLGDATNVTNGITSNAPLSIHIPINAALGHTTMRIATLYIGNLGDQEPLPITNSFDGEVEDYTLRLLPTKQIEEFGFENLKIYPNPNNGNFYIKLNGSISRDISLNIFDANGKHLHESTLKATGDLNADISLQGIQSGLYLLKLNDGLKTEVKKVVIK